MDWTFNIGWVFLGLLIVGVGAVIVFYHQKIANNIASGISSYDRTKLFGVLAIILGLLIMTNLHTLILTTLVNLVINR